MRWLCKRRRLRWWRHTPEGPAGPAGGRAGQTPPPGNSATFLSLGAQRHPYGRHCNTLTYIEQPQPSDAFVHLRGRRAPHGGGLTELRGGAARRQLPAQEGHAGHAYHHAHQVPHQGVPHLQPQQSHDLHLDAVGTTHPGRFTSLTSPMEFFL